jgi:hypothetical protein
VIGFMSGNQQHPDMMCEVFIVGPSDLVDAEEIPDAQKEHARGVTRWTRAADAVAIARWRITPCGVQSFSEGFIVRSVQRADSMS